MALVYYNLLNLGLVYHLPPGRLPEAICIICPKGLYLLPEEIVSFARWNCIVCPKGEKVCRLPEAYCVICPKESVSFAWQNCAEYSQIYSVMQSDGNRFCRDVVLDSFNMAYGHKDNGLDQKYEKQISLDR